MWVVASWVTCCSVSPASISAVLRAEFSYPQLCPSISGQTRPALVRSFTVRQDTYWFDPLLNGCEEMLMADHSSELRSEKRVDTRSRERIGRQSWCTGDMSKRQSSARYWGNTWSRNVRPQEDVQWTPLKSVEIARLSLSFTHGQVTWTERSR